jgi:putative ABC transport system permease protein
MRVSFFGFILKNLLQRKFRSALTVCGVAVAITAVVSLVGIAHGFETSLTELYESRGVDLLVVRAGTTERLGSSLPEKVGEEIRRLPGVRLVSPGLMDMVSFEKGHLIGVPLQGWTADSFMFEGLKVIDGRLLRAGDRHAVMLGVVLAKNLGKKAGDRLEIEGQDFEVVGVFESFNVFENGSAVVLLSDLQQLMDRPGQVTGFQVVLEDTPDRKAAVERVRKEVEKLHDDKGRPYRLSALPTKDYVKSTTQIRMGQAMAWLTSAIALVIGAIGVLNTMIMSVFERTREIGILRAVGWRRSRVVRLILYESLLLSVVGAGVGIGGAVLLVRAFSQSQAASGLVRPDVSPAVMAQGLVIALAVGLIGGAYPALRGSRLAPTEALRHE